MRYVCQICGYVYDDDREKIPFAALPDDWRCPVCKASKADFKPEAAPAASPAQQEAESTLYEADDADLQKLSYGQLAALFSNLARGSEKQYKPEAAALYAQLAEWFADRAQAQADAGTEKLERLLQSDVAAYPGVRAAADAAGDRGAARSTVWGEKVTRMLLSLVSRYREEGEAMLTGMEVWVCTACGFVYIGQEPPALCPVCKVPAWKFEKAEGR